MKKLTLILMLLSLAGLSGCKVGDYIYDTRTVETGEVVEVDSVETDAGLVPVDEYEGDLAAEVIPAGTAIVEVVHEPKAWVRTAAGAAGSLPVPFADVFGILAMTGLGIGATWLNKKRRVAEKVAESSIKSIDAFRDILDQTEGGAKIDEKLTELLRDYQRELAVADEVHRLLKRYATPAKTPIAQESR